VRSEAGIRGLRGGQFGIGRPQGGLVDFLDFGAMARSSEDWKS
jgi:hypothetical protein